MPPPPGRRRRSAAPSRRMLLLMVLLLLPAMAGEALAHASNPDFLSQVRGVTPAAPGLQVRMLGGDDRLEVRNPGHHTVVVLGYEGEPYARLLPDGSAQVNVHSPATYLNQDRFAKVTLPPQADAKAAPLWKPYTSTGRLEWHDHRAHWMGAGTPPQVTDTSARTKVFDYRVPIVVDGRRSTIEGTLFWVGRPGGPSIFAMVGLGLIPALLVAAAALFWVGRRRDRGPGPGDDPPAREAW